MAARAMVPLIRVVMLESGGWGGLAHYSYNLGNALAQSGCDMALQTQAPYELDALPRDFALRTFDASLAYRDRWREMRAAIGELRADLLHVQSTISARRDWLQLARLRRARTPLVVTAHNVLPHDAEERDAPGMRWAFGRIYAACDAIIVHGEDTKRQLIEAFRLEDQWVAVVPHGDYAFAIGAQSRQQARAALGIDADAMLLLCFGALRAYKGIPDLIDAFAVIADEFPAAHLMIVGKPIRVDVDTYRERIERAGIRERVTLRPEYVPFDEIGRYFAACDIAVYPYRRVHQSGALQLAYGAGRPVIATATGELAGTVRDRHNGLLVPPGDPPALAGALGDLMSRPHRELEQMGERSRELAATAHRWEDAAQQTAALYREVAARARARA